MSSDRQLNYVNNLQNRDQNLYYVDDASELNSINLKENDKIYAINDNKLFQMEIVDQEEELSGSIVSFNGRNNTKIKSVVANIKPVQDLHGQDAPYPPGGGKQLLDASNPSYISTAIEYTHNENGSVITLTSKSSSYAYVYAAFDFTSYVGKTVYFNGTKETNNALGYIQIRYKINDSTQYVEVGSAFNPSRGFSIPAEATTAGLYIMLKNTSSGTGAAGDYAKYTNLIVSETSSPVWSPYSNECPISGWTGLSLTRDGVNVWDEVIAEGSIDVSTGEDNNTSNSFRSKNYIPVFSQKSYYLHCASGETTFVFGYDSDKQFVNLLRVNGSVYIGNKVITIPSGVSYIRFSKSSAGSVYNHDISINYPSTDTSYHAYTGEVIPISWQDSAGTVHGGNINLTTGVLNAKWVNVDISTLDYTPSSPANHVFRTNSLHSIIKAPANSGILAEAISSEFWQKAYSPISANDNGAFAVVGDDNPSISGRLLFIDHRYSSIEDFVSGNTGVQLVYPLATPVTIQLDPVTVSTLLGENNIWVNTGDITVKIAEKGITAFELKPYT